MLSVRLSSVAALVVAGSLAGSVHAAVLFSSNFNASPTSTTATIVNLNTGTSIGTWASAGPAAFHAKINANASGADNAVVVLGSNTTERAIR